MTFKVGDVVRRKVDGVVMVIVDTVTGFKTEWKCAWMDGYRRTGEFYSCEFVHHEPTTTDGTASEIKPSLALESQKPASNDRKHRPNAH